MTNITGTSKVLANINRQVSAIKNRTRAGLWDGALIIQARSMELTPHDTGHLKGSTYAVIINTQDGSGAEIGYTAFYAPFVHEIDKNYKVGQWKFLATAMQQKRKEVLEAIRKRARI